MNEQNHNRLRTNALNALPMVGLLTVLAACSGSVQAQNAMPAASMSTTVSDDLVSKGEYLTRAADCQPCHTVPGGKPFAGGRPFKIPGGTLYSANITPSLKGGIGDWSDDQFVRAVREGIDDHGGQMYPAMSYTSYAKLSRDDVLAIKAYLFSLPAVDQRRPRADISWPFNQRWAIKYWNMLFFDNKEFQPDASKSAEWNRGAYLVEALGHCGECHTPRNVFMATKASKPLAGGEAEGWHAYNISSDPVSGLGGWSDEEIIAYLKTGLAQGKAWANGPMGEAVDASLKHLNDADLKAVVSYLRTVPPTRGNESKPRYAWTADGRLDVEGDSEGARLYTFYCSGCHGADGKTSTKYYPAMVGQGTVGANPPQNLIMIILHGARSNDHPNVFMPGYRDAFNDEQVAALVNYVTKRFGDPKASVKAGDVADARKQP
jgi:mono/diheme cytochrome c family protein